MSNCNASVTHGGAIATPGTRLSGQNGGFPSFRLVDTVSTDSSSAGRAYEEFAPLRFTLSASQWSNNGLRPQLIRPTLISPAGPQDYDSIATHSTANAPSLPAMEELKSKHKRPPSEGDAPASFLPCKKRAVSYTLDDDLAGFPTDLSPEDLYRIKEAEPRTTEAASILLRMKTEILARSPVSEGQDVQMELAMFTRSASVASMSSSITTSSDSPPVTTRSVTPGPGGMRLALPEDTQELNSLHCFVRAELLELFALPVADDELTSPEQSRIGRRSMSTTTRRQKCSGRVGLRCIYCAHLPRRERNGSTMSSFYPKSLNDIYRSVCTWQRIHFRTCHHIPPEVREGYAHLKETDRTRGKTRYWLSSARRLGLVDVGSERGGICFAPTNPSSTPSSP